MTSELPTSMTCAPSEPGGPAWEALVTAAMVPSSPTQTRPVKTADSFGATVASDDSATIRPRMAHMAQTPKCAASTERYRSLIYLAALSAAAVGSCWLLT